MHTGGLALARRPGPPAVRQTRRGLVRRPWQDTAGGGVWDESWARVSCRASLAGWRETTAPSSNHSPAVSAVRASDCLPPLLLSSQPCLWVLPAEIYQLCLRLASMGSHQQPWFRGPKDVPPFSPFTVLTVRPEYPFGYNAAHTELAAVSQTE